MDLKADTFGDRLRTSIMLKYKSQSDFARKTGIGIQTVNKYILNIRHPNTQVLCLMCKALDVSADYLLFGKGE